MPQYLTPNQLSDRLAGRISVRTLANWRCLGIGPKFTRLGGRIAYKLSEVEAWESKNTVSNTSQYKR